jgi:predicted acyl esterase
MGITLDPAVLQRLSLPVHDVHEERDVFVTMRDGVRVAIDVFRPRAEGRYPALVSISGYGKDVQTRLERPLPLSPQRGNGGQEAGDTDFWVKRGYVHVIVDARGSGKSEGEYSFHGTRRATGRCRDGGMGGSPALVQRQGRHAGHVVISA